MVYDQGKFSGADDGNRTRTVSLGSRLTHSQVVFSGAEMAVGGPGS